MATITLQTTLAGPTEPGGSCKVLYEVTNTDGVVPEIFVVKQDPPEYPGADPRLIWQHVAYADELVNLPTAASNNGSAQLVRKAVVTLYYDSLDKVNTAIQSIRSQIQRLVNELNTLSTYSTTNTWIISSTN